MTFWEDHLSCCKECQEPPTVLMSRALLQSVLPSFSTCMLFLTAAAQQGEGEAAWRQSESGGRAHKNPAERKWQRCRSCEAKAKVFFSVPLSLSPSLQRWTLIIWRATIEAEIREITSIVSSSPTDTDCSAEGRIGRMEEHNLAAHHAAPLQRHNGSSAALCWEKTLLNLDVRYLKVKWRSWNTYHQDPCRNLQRRLFYLLPVRTGPLFKKYVENKHPSLKSDGTFKRI